MSSNPLEVLLNEKKEEFERSRSETKKIKHDLVKMADEYSKFCFRLSTKQFEKISSESANRQLDEDIEKTTVQICFMKAKIEAKKLDIEFQQKFFDDFMKKAQKYREKFDATCNSTSNSRRDLDEMLAKIEAKHLEKWITEHEQEANNIINGERLRKTRDEYSRLTVHRSLVLQQMKQVEHEIKGSEDKLAYIRQQTEILKKRNAAQLTRLNKQINDAMIKNQTSRHAAYQLENEIVELHKELNQTC